MDIALIGTSHHFQAFGQPGAADFESEIERILDAHLSALAEEMSNEGLHKLGATESVCSRVAERRCLRYARCDPDEETRKHLGIPTNEWDVFFCPMSSRASDREIEQRISDQAYGPREHYWLDRLAELDGWPLLFVCGAKHVDTFAVKAEARGRTVRVFHRKWGAGTGHHV